jgi:hypothetical protein
MTSKMPDTQQELAEYEEELPAPSDVEDIDDEDKPTWSGRSSKIALAPGANINRNFQYVGYHSECIDCKAAGKPGRRDHQFHALASKVGGVWTGPEGSHIEDLKAQGMLNKTREADERLAREREIANIRGVEKSTHCPACHEPIGRDPQGQLLGLCKNNHRNGLEELRPRTLAQMKKVWANALPFEKAQSIERGQIRDEVRQLREAAGQMGADIAAAIRDALREER